MKYLITSALALAIASTSFAQLNPRVGIKGGLNLTHATSYIDGPAIGNHKTSGFGPGFYVGGLLEVSGKNKSSKLKGQAELQYNYLTSRFDDGVNINNRFHVLNIPVSLKYFVKPHMSFIVGINNNINLAGSNKIKGADKAHEFTNLNTYQPGAHVGFNYYFKKGIFLDLRYNYNLGTTLDLPNDSYYRYGNAQIGIGYKF